jgi:hypothetical protein
VRELAPRSPQLYDPTPSTPINIQLPIPSNRRLPPRPRTDTSSTPNSLLTQAGFLNRRGRVIRGSLIAVSSLSWLWLHAEAYNIARPIYVCRYPVSGDYVRHLHEKRMRIQWLCYFAAAVLAAGTVVHDFCYGKYLQGFNRQG